MKKVVSLMLVWGMLFTLAACGKDAAETATSEVLSLVPQEDAVAAGSADQQKDSLEAGRGSEEVDVVSPVGPQSASAGDISVSKDNDAGQEDAKIDVDLTQLSSTMVYSEVYNMLYAPEEYIGKTVKMNGAFAISCQEMDENGQPDLNYPIYYACIIADATACCSQGLEFVPTGDFSYPDDTPLPGEEITVTGTFETYEEDGFLYCHLVDAKLAT